MPDFSLKDDRPCRLVPNSSGLHRFGGEANINGLTPTGSSVPVQLVLELDLSDPAIPIESSIGVTRLPLVYPFKYGGGGAEIQYSVDSNGGIKILWMSDDAPDPPGEQYLQVPTLPQVRLSLEPLSYEQARILAFMRHDGFFQPNDDDLALLRGLDTNNLISIGGRRDSLTNAASFVCHNPACKRYNLGSSPIYFALVPSIEIDGSSEFWYEYDGGVTFYFAWCWHCRTIYSSNVCS